MSGVAYIPDVLYGYSGHIHGLHEQKLERTFGNAVRRVVHAPLNRDPDVLRPHTAAAPIRPLQPPPTLTPQQKAFQLKPNAHVPGYTGHVPQLWDHSLQNTFGKATNSALTDVGLRIPTPVRETSSTILIVSSNPAAPRPSTPNSVDRHLPGYTGYIPNRNQHDLGRTYGAATHRAIQHSPAPPRSITPTRTSPAPPPSVGLPDNVGKMPGKFYI